MKNNGLLAMIALTVLFLVFTAGYMTGALTDRKIIISNNVAASDSSDATEDTTIGVFIDGRLNINTASIDDLMLLPGIGETLAQNIISYRENNGSFKSIEELLNVKGIGNTRLENLSEYITVAGG